VAATKPKALGMVNVRESIPKLRLRLPPQAELLELSGRCKSLRFVKARFANVFFKTHWQERAFLLEYAAIKA